MLRWVVRTDGDLVKLVLRLILGVIFLAHGSQKVLGLFGGPGFSGTIQMFGQMGVPAALAMLVMFFEFCGGIGLILGFLTRLWALGISVIMMVAIAIVHLPNGLFMNWMGNQKGEGFEYHLLALCVCLVLLVYGAGRYSLDRLLSRQ